MIQTKSRHERGKGLEIGLLIARVIAGGSLLLAGYFKLQSGPLLFQGAIEAFRIFPQWSTAAMAYFVPWLEIVLGVALVAGVWTRQAGLLTVGLFAAFTLALASVILRGMKVDCGCFGGLMGEAAITWWSVARNVILIAISAVPMIFGGGRFSLLREQSSPAPAPQEPVAPQTAEPA